MKAWLSLTLCLLLLFAACGQAASPDRSESVATEAPVPAVEASVPAEETPASVPSPEPAATARAYPYLDENGYYHYQIRLNGQLLPLEHDALLQTNGNQYNEIVYPLSEILDYFRVAYYLDAASGEFSSIVNNVSFSHQADLDAMYFDNLGYWYGNAVLPEMIDGVFYAPNYALEHTIGAVLTKIAKGEEETLACIDITTGSDVILWGAGSSVPNIVRYTGD